MLRARLFYEIFWFYRGKPTRDQYIETMNDFSEFFRFDEHAHFVSFVVYVRRLFDNDARAISLLSLAKQSKPNAGVRKLLAEAVPIVKKVRTIRNKAVAHGDSEMTYNAWIEQADITFNEMRELTEITLKVVNLLSVDNGQDEVHFAELPAQDLEDMLKVLSQLPRRR